MKQQISYKNFFINYAIFALIVAFVFGILIYLTRVSQKSWDQNLKAVIETSLAESEPDTWELGKQFQIIILLAQALPAMMQEIKRMVKTIRLSL